MQQVITTVFPLHQHMCSLPSTKSSCRRFRGIRVRAIQSAFLTLYLRISPPFNHTYDPPLELHRQSTGRLFSSPSLHRRVSALIVYLQLILPSMSILPIPFV